MDREFFRYRYLIIRYAKYSITYNLWTLFPLIFVLDCTYDTVKLIKISFGLPEFQLLYVKGSSPNSHIQVPSCLSSVPPIQASPALITTSKRTIKTLEENYSHSLTKNYFWTSAVGDVPQGTQFLKRGLSFASFQL